HAPDPFLWPFEAPPHPAPLTPGLPGICKLRTFPWAVPSTTRVSVDRHVSCALAPSAAAKSFPSFHGQFDQPVSHSSELVANIGNRLCASTEPDHKIRLLGFAS